MPLRLENAEKIYTCWPSHSKIGKKEAKLDFKMISRKKLTELLQFFSFDGLVTFCFISTPYTYHLKDCKIIKGAIH